TIHLNNKSKDMKIEKKLTILLLSGICSAGFSQNSSNLNFSEIEETPKKLSKIKLAKGWNNPNRGTADLYSKEGNQITGIPNNQVGNQEAFNGSSYVGIVAYMDDAVMSWKELLTGDGYVEKKGYNKYTEYIQTKLATPLVAGQAYDMSFRVSLAEKSGRAINGLGMHLSKEIISSKLNSFLSASPQVKSENIIENKKEWVEIKDRYIAIGGEQYITIGLFNGVDKMVDISKETNNRRAYYYIDGISILPFNEPDSDNDGVIDKEDECPSKAGLTNLKGCPDADADGIVDKEDRCPDEKGLKELKGCPDSDGDGLANKDDACPTVAGLPENNGCPKVKEAELKVFEKALNGVKFKSGSDRLTSSSFAILNDVVKILEDNSIYNLKINGHTDSSGDDAKNLKLSKQRAKAVEAYLVKKGIDDKRLASDGFGETISVADNKTSNGRALNRRVELKVEFTKLIK
ncbi:MAG: hypothetical protein COB15_12340, partial [Flavobacteriales bacterium]